MHFVTDEVPNVSRDLDPKFDDEIDAEIVDVETDTVTSDGWAHVEGDYELHAVAWAPFRVDGQLEVTNYDQKKKNRVQTWVHTDKGVNIGTEEWAGERIVLLILDEKVE